MPVATGPERRRCTEPRSGRGPHRRCVGTYAAAEITGVITSVLAGNPVKTTTVRKVAALLSLACGARCANPNARYDEAERALSAGAWQQAIDRFKLFLADADCGTESEAARCKEARVVIAECGLRLGNPTEAYFALEAARRLKPQGGPLDARIDRLEQEAQDTLAAGFSRSPGDGKLSVWFTREVHDRFRLREVRFLLDLHPIPTGSLPSYVAGTTMLMVPPTSVPAGRHEIEVVADFAGHGWGSYAYLHLYTFSSGSSRAIVIAPSAETQVDVRAYDDPDAAMIDALHADFIVRSGNGPPGSGR